MATCTIPNRPAGTGEPRSIAKITANFDSILNFINGQNLDPNNFSESLVNEKLGLSDVDTVRRGAFSQATESAALTSTSYSDLSNGPDQVSNIVVPSNACIWVAYRALWRGTKGSATVNFGDAAIWLNSNQIAKQGNATPSVPDTAGGSASLNASGSVTATGKGALLTTRGTATDPKCLYSPQAPASGSDSSFATAGNGTIIEWCPIYVSAGTYNVAVKYRAAASCSLYVSERLLLVKVEALS